jgi:hypothetical protein
VAEGRGRASARGAPPGSNVGDLLGAAAWRRGWDRSSRRAKGEERRAAAEAGRVGEVAEAARQDAARIRARADALERVAERLAGERRRAQEGRQEREVEEAWRAG